MEDKTISFNCTTQREFPLYNPTYELYNIGDFLTSTYVDYFVEICKFFDNNNFSGKEFSKQAELIEKYVG